MVKTLRQRLDADQDCPEVEPPLLLRRAGDDVPVAFQKEREHRPRQRLALVEREMAEGVVPVGAADLPEVDDPGVAAFVLEVVGGVEVAVGEASLLCADPCVAIGHRTADRPDRIVPEDAP